MIKVIFSIVALTLILSSCAQTKQVQKSISSAQKEVTKAIPDKVSIQKGERKTYTKAIAKPLYDVNLMKQKFLKNYLKLAVFISCLKVV